MLHHRSNDGKLLWGETKRIRNRGIEDHDAISDSEKGFVELEFPYGWGKERDDTYEIETESKDKYDIRKRPEVGD